jgi:Spy/CpxP family protein refolding chaperone
VGSEDIDTHKEELTMMTSRVKIVVAAVLSTILWSAPAFADGHGARGHSMAWGWPILQSLGLTDAQKAQVHQVFVNHRPQLSALRAQLRAAEHQLGDKLYGPTPPAPADLAPVNQLRAQLAQERLQVALDIRNVLRPDQLAKAAQVRQQLDALRSQMKTLLNPGP